MPSSTGFRLKPETLQMLKELASNESRSQTGQIEYMIKREYKKIKRSCKNMEKIFGNLETDGVEIYSENGILVICDNNDRKEYPDTGENREMLINLAKELMNEWIND